MLRKIISFVFVGLVLAAGAGFVVYRTAAASTQTQEPTRLTAFGRGGGMVGVADEHLAQALGISVEDLQAAYQKAWEAALAQAVEEGKLTQEQANQIKSRGFGRFGPHQFGGWVESEANFDSLLAEALGITVEKLQAAYQTAAEARLDQAVSDGRITQEQADLMKARTKLYADQDFTSSLKNAWQQAVQAAADKGVITQEQADQIIQNSQEQGLPGFGGFGKHGFGFEGGRGHGFGGGWLPHGRPAAPPTTTP